MIPVCYLMPNPIWLFNVKLRLRCHKTQSANHSLGNHFEK